MENKKIIYYKQLDSTNTEITRLAAQGAEHGTVVVADAQTAGKGRRGRQWESPAGENIYMSVLLRPDCLPDRAPMLTLVMAYSVAKVLKELGFLDVQIKWPNDILVNEKKVCGILTEMKMEGTKISSIVIGTGINVNQDNFPEEISDIATSLKKESGKVQSRENLVKRICELFEEYFEMFMASKDLSGILEEYNLRLISLGRRVKVLDPQNEFIGEALGINSQGELLVKKESGEIVKIYAGEVSVRGIYGYV